MPSELYYQVNWILAALDLYLDMERNESDNRYADDKRNEIIYSFDEDIFELFVGGTDQIDPDDKKSRIYTDRRKAVGVFHIEAWRSQEEITGLDRREEAAREAINRQSAVLTSEWLFSGTLPGRKDPSIYISRQHLRELSSRWERLIKHYRAKLPFVAASEQELILALESDQASTAREGSTDLACIPKYIENAAEPLRGDLRDLWSAIRDDNQSDAERAQSFWRFAFSRKLAATLAALEAREPVSQLLRLNGEIAGKLKYLHQAMKPDDPKPPPASETSDFWRERLANEIDDRKRRNSGFQRVNISGDAHTIALVQTLANTAVRRNERKRFVFVTASPIVIDVYRAWHCMEAGKDEPFVLRPVRQFAPLLNVSSMSTAVKSRPKEDIFPLLGQALEPILFSLNLNTDNVRPEGHEDSVRWYREQYAYRLRTALREYKAHSLLSDRQVEGNADREERLRVAVAHRVLFPTALSDLKAVRDRLVGVMSRGRRLERLAIGFGFSWLDGRLTARKYLQEALKSLTSGDESPLANLMQGDLTELRSVTLELLIELLNISAELQRAARKRMTSPRKVPLVLRLTLETEGASDSIAVEANRMVERALAEATSARAQSSSPLDLDLQNLSIRGAGGFRLFALYSCIALRLNEWAVAYHCAGQAFSRARTGPGVDEIDHIELQYLYAICIRFLIGMGEIKDATGEDITFLRYGRARGFLEKQLRSGRNAFRAKSELTSLIFFACAWALFDDAPSKSFPSVLIEDHFGECLDYINELHVMRAGYRSGALTSEISEHELSEIEEQIAVNTAACYCLARLGTLDQYKTVFQQDYVPNISETALEWVSSFANECREQARECSHIAKFYFKWFAFLWRGAASIEELKEAEQANLVIDQVVARRFRDGFLPR